MITGKRTTDHLDRGMIPLTCAEVRRVLIVLLVEPAHPRSAPTRCGLTGNDATKHRRTTQYQRQKAVVAE